MTDADIVAIPRTDAAIMIGLTAYLEQYLGPAPGAATLESLVNRLQRDLVRYGLASDDREDQARAVRGMNDRLHRALGDRAGHS